MNKEIKNIYKNTSLFSYFGCKDREMDEIIKNIPENIKNYDVIEPFCGWFALIRYLINILKIDTNYICNDNDDNLIDLFKCMVNEEENNKVVEEIKNYMIDINKNKYNEIKKIKNNSSYLFARLLYCIRYGLFPTAKKVNINYERLKNFIIYKKVNFICCDAYDLIEKNKDNENAFLELNNIKIKFSTFVRFCGNKHITQNNYVANY